MTTMTTREMNVDSEDENEIFPTDELVNTCGVCEHICREDEIETHPCLESYSSYYINKNTRYFYPQCDDGSLVRRSLVEGEEVNVVETPNECVSQAPDEEGFEKENVPSNLKQRKIFIEEHLIEAVRRRLPLWNFKLPLEERGIRTKEKLWMEVATVMQGLLTPKEVQNKWKTLLDTYRKQRKALELPSGSGYSKKSKWIHMDRMDFLRDLFISTKTVTNSIEPNDDSVDGDSTVNSLEFDSVSTRSSLRTDSRRQTSRRSEDIVQNIQNIMNQPVQVDVAANETDNDQYAAFGMVVAAKLRALSEDASERAMMTILNALHAERLNDRRTRPT